MSGIGVRIAGTGSAVPEQRLTNHDLASMVDTNDEWIVQRTGIHERRIINQEAGESQFTLATSALERALADASMQGSDLDLIINATVSSDMTCPSTAHRIANELGAAPVAAFDMQAACCGFVYAMNLADSLIRSGRHKAVGVIGCDAMSTLVDYEDRSMSILFGDAGGAAVLTADDNPTLGCIHQVIEGDGNGWESLYIPRKERDVVPGAVGEHIKLGCLRMDGRSVYKFAVNKFINVIQDAFESTGLTVDDVSQVICHQSNIRMINSAKEKLGLPDDKVYINIDKYGNSSAGSVGLCFDQLRKDGRINTGDTIIMVAFGGGMTWSSGVWQL